MRCSHRQGPKLPGEPRGFGSFPAWCAATSAGSAACRRLVFLGLEKLLGV